MTKPDVIIPPVTTSRATRPNYGIDAPGLVKVALYIASLFIGLVVVGLIAGSPSTILSVMLGMGLVCLVEGLLMVRSSKHGKLRERVRVVDQLDLQGAERVLDVGCGRGLLLNEVARRLDGGTAVGIDLFREEDLSGNRVESTLQNAALEGVSGRVEVHEGDARDLPFESSSFDAVVSSMTLHNIRDAAGRAQAVREIDRVLKPGGRAVVVDMAKTSEYVKTLSGAGWTDVTSSKLVWALFPPVRWVIGTKPAL
jgi:SAM-dependent methyltransferase